MTDAFDERRKAQEESYFDKENKRKLEDLAKRTERLSPITGKPMVQEEIMGVTIDRCVDSGGIWLDAGELEELLGKSKEPQEDGFFTRFLAGIIK
jgi:hypothetical protein